MLQTDLDRPRLVTISVVPEGPLVRAEGELVPSSWRWRMECGYCHHVIEVSMPHGLRTRSMSSYGDTMLNHVKRHWVLSESETAHLAAEEANPAR